MARFAYLTNTTWVQQFNGERWVNVPPEFRDKCLADIAEHRQALIWRSNVAEFYRDDSGLTMREADVLVRCVDCGALIETTVHCDNCGSFHPTRGLR